MALKVVRQGLLTTVQDGGRAGMQHAGVSVGGAMDPLALRLANLLVGNGARAAGLELTLVGPTLALEADVLLALGGADLSATLDGRPLPRWRAVAARRGSELAFDGVRDGCRAYLALAGGVDVPEVLGGRGTDLRGHFGGLDGRPLRAGDALGLGAPSPWAERLLAQLLAAPEPVARFGPRLDVLPAYTDAPRLRVVPGPEHARFTRESRAALVETAFLVSPQSDRMGARLEGRPLVLEAPLELVSSPVTEGTVQVPPDGAPIVLMADRQTTGGYPRIAQVATVDLPLLAQARPGTRVRFAEVTVAEAQEALAARERALGALTAALQRAVR